MLHRPERRSGKERRQNDRRSQAYPIVLRDQRRDLERREDDRRLSLLQKMKNKF